MSTSRSIQNPGSKGHWPVVFGGSPNTCLPASRRKVHAGRVRSPSRFGALPFALLLVPIISFAQQATPTASPGEVEVESVVVSATRFDIPLDQSPASASVINSEEMEQKQIQRVSDALREVPGLSVVQTGSPGQLTSVFTRGLRSEHTQILLDGIPINQGLQGAFNFADFTTDDIDRVEVVRGPQSTIYGPRALAGVIQIFTKQGTGTPGVMFAAEGGSYDSFREWSQSDGKVNDFDYSIGASRFDTQNARPNNNYRNTAAISDVGWSPNEQLRISSLFTYSVSDIGLPNTIFDPRPIDHFLTERWLIGPHIDWKPTEWWDHKLIVAYDHERQINDPNEDGFVGATRAVFERTQVDYQNDLRPASWLTLTSGFFYSRINAGQERPFVLFGPTFISDHTNETAGFLETTLTPLENLIFVAGGRYDHFNQFGGIWTYRFAGSYKIDKTNTIFHSSVGTGFSPPSSQDKIFGNNFGLKPEEDFGWDIGIRQQMWQNRLDVGLTYFHNDLSNVIGFNGLFDTLNLGAAETQGLEAELHAQPIPNLVFTATYTYLEAEKTSSKDVSQLQGARLPRRPRNEVYVSATYLWCQKLRTVVEAKFVNAREELNFGGPNFDIEDYSFANIAAEYEINPYLSVFGRVDNITNEHYSEVFGFPALGRAAYGGVKLRF
ncbi:MAG TPA: TonB-dependent receptor [Candidatus Udaeobacter sp.]|jgi:vitamin B12 transporter|nr:TonB-dependent receptor [Candidatus Udaeobacter sp.]